MLLYKEKGVLQMWLSLEFGNEGIILDYLGGS